MKQMYYLFLFVVLLNIFISPIQAQVIQPIPDLKFTKNSADTGPIIKRTDIYDCQPSAMSENQQWKIWDCGFDNTDNAGDAVIYSKFSDQGQRLTIPTAVLKKGTIPSAPDSQFACSPSVVKFDNTNIDLDGPNGNLTNPGDELYLMYYECAPVFYNKCDGSQDSTNNNTVTCNPGLSTYKETGSFTQICLAASNDGINWHKYNNSLFTAPNWLHYGNLQDPATPLIKVNPAVANNCGFSESDLTATGKYRIYLQSDKCVGNLSGNYGTGHPTAYVKNYSDHLKQIWLWYIDTKGDWGNRKIYLTKSWDGFNFETPIETNLKYVSDIRYYPNNFNGHQGIYIGLSAISNNYFVYSYDGVTWIQPNYDDAWWYGRFVLNKTDAEARDYAKQQITAFLVGGAKIGDVRPNNLCVAPGASSMLADKYGNISSLANLNIFSNEGYMGKLDGCTSANGCKCYNQAEDISRGSTWGIYKLNGSFTAGDLTPIFNLSDLRESILNYLSDQNSAFQNADLQLNALDIGRIIKHLQ
jgi:hypothetical protein